MNTTNKVDWTAEVQSAVLAMKEEGQKAYTFMKHEAPEVAAEYVAWKRVESGTEVVTGMVCAAVLAWVSVWMFKKKLNDDLDRMMVYTGATLVGLVSFVYFCSAASDIPTAIKPWISPRITIIEGIKEVVK